MLYDNPLGLLQYKRKQYRGTRNVTKLLYLIFSATSTAVLIVLLWIGLTSPHRMKGLFGRRPNKKQALLVFIPLFFVALVSSVFATWLFLNGRMSQKKQPTSTLQIRSGGKTKTVELPQYEKISDTDKNGVRRITYWVDSNDVAKISLVNEKVFPEYKSDKTKTLYLNYFDDKTVAATYYDRLKDAKISNEVKKELTGHFIGSQVVVGQIEQLIFPAKNLEANGSGNILGTKK